MNNLNQNTMNIYANGGLFGLLHIEQLRDKLRSTGQGRRIVNLQDQKEESVDYMVGFLQIVLSITIAVATYFLTSFITAVFQPFEKIGVIVVLFSFFASFFYLGISVRNWYLNTPYIKGIDKEIEQIANQHQPEKEILEELKACSTY